MSLTFLVTVVGVAIATFFAPPVYETTSSLLVRFGRQFIYRSEAGRDIDDVLNRSRESIINAEIDILNSDDQQKEVIDEIGAKSFTPISPRDRRRNGNTARLVAWRSTIGFRMNESNTSARFSAHRSRDRRDAAIPPSPGSCEDLEAFSGRRSRLLRAEKFSWPGQVE
jgi:uncharacterized protein involved in exopolysaccharide biosynthesis